MAVSNNKIAVLLAAYNGEKYIQEQIESINQQILVDVDIYISLDISSDSSLSIINQLQEKYKNIKLLEYGNRFGSAGQNFFRLLLDLNFNNYGYIAFADQDDIWLENKLDAAVTLMIEEGSHGYSSNVIAFWESGKEKLIKKSSPQTQFDYLFESAGPGCTFVLTSELARSIQSFLKDNLNQVSSIWLHDWFCYAYARAFNYKWVIDKNAYMRYRQHSNNSIGANSGIQSFIKRFKSVATGDAFSKVIHQAEIIKQTNTLPIILLKKNSFLSYIRLMTLSSQCRRAVKDKIILFYVIFLKCLKII